MYFMMRAAQRAGDHADMVVAVMKIAIIWPRRADGIPVSEVQDDAGEEAGLEDAEQEARNVELRRRRDEHHRRGDDAPAEHDAQQRLARADPLEHQVARHLEQEVADEEDAGAQAVDRSLKVSVCFICSCA